MFTIKSMDLTVVCLILIGVSGVSSLTCLTCKGISKPRHCMTVDDCYPGEVCGVEKLKNDFGETFYNVGCFVESKCQNTTAYQDGYGDCRECCRSDLCNAQGCGQSGYPHNRGPVCYNCRSNTNPDLCHNIAFCEQGDVCKYDVLKVFGDDVYSSACSSSHACKVSNKQEPSIVGRDLTEAEPPLHSLNLRRSVTEHVCSGCCDQDLCNKGCNGTSLIKGTDFCQPNPCVHGTCVPNSSNYTCICIHGFTGQDCETATDFCQPNPCVHGTCVPNSSNYTCICMQGFIGPDCETATSTDCYDIYHNNIGQTSGVYYVTLWRSNQTIQVYCDMDIAPYGWTVFQKRFNGSVDFYRNFTEYTNGFGNIHGEFWLGLSFIEEMAAHYETDIRIDLTAADNDRLYESFENFSLSSYPDFTLHLGRRTASPLQDNTLGFSFHNGSKFSTFDHDADPDVDNCAEKRHGGWWYYKCVNENLNGEYVSPPGGQSSFESGRGGFIYSEWKDYATLKSSKLMFRKH